MFDDPSFLYALGAGIAGGGVAWGGVVTSLRGIKETQAQVKADLQRHEAADMTVQLDLVGRLARIEGKLDEMRHGSVDK